MARRAKNIYKRKDGRWEGRYIKERVNGKQHRTDTQRNFRKKRSAHPAKVSTLPINTLGI